MPVINMGSWTHPALILSLSASLLGTETCHLQIRTFVIFAQHACRGGAQWQTTARTHGMQARHRGSMTQRRWHGTHAFQACMQIPQLTQASAWPNPGGPLSAPLQSSAAAVSSTFPGRSLPTLARTQKLFQNCRIAHARLANTCLSQLTRWTLQLDNTTLSATSAWLQTCYL